MNVSYILLPGTSWTIPPSPIMAALFPSCEINTFIQLSQLHPGYQLCPQLSKNYIINIEEMMVCYI